MYKQNGERIQSLFNTVGNFNACKSLRLYMCAYAESLSQKPSNRKETS